MTDFETRHLYERIIPIILDVEDPADFFAFLAASTDAYCTHHHIGKIDKVRYLTAMVDSLIKNMR